VFAQLLDSKSNTETVRFILKSIKDNNPEKKNDLFHVLQTLNIKNLLKYNINIMPFVAILDKYRCKYISVLVVKKFTSHP